jgi:Cu(I)/Ag(I) efflux system membrane fusion protein/cobalt-zinc-cadmium efflux system membrane fusion protein
MKRSGLISKFLILIALLAALGGGYYWGSSRHIGHDDHAGEDTGAKTQYTCGMHPFIIQDEPGLCPICNMQLTPLKGGAAGTAAAERQVKHWVSPMDPTYVRDTPGQDAMGHDLVPVYEGGTAGTVQIDPITTQNMGVRTEPVRRAALARTIRTVGVVAYDEPRQYSVNSKSDGWVERLHVNQQGQPVKKGQPLLEIYSPELVAAQQEYLLAVRGYQRLADSTLPQVGENARRLLDASRTRLRYWDISEKQIAALEQSGEARKTLTLYSPQGGVVTVKKVLEGMRVMAGEELLQIADLSRVWVNADIYEYELPWVKVGQTARVELPFAPDQVLSGKITYIYPFVQNETRTVRARIEFPNPGLALKPEMYANVLIDTAAVADALAVPEHAVLKSGRGQTVFVALGEGKFEPRAVVTGVTNDDGLVQILSGLKDGEQVVTSAQFMLDSESKLREAIEKMLAPKDAMPAAESKDDLDDLFN